MVLTETERTELTIVELPETKVRTPAALSLAVPGLVALGALAAIYLGFLPF